MRRQAVILAAAAVLLSACGEPVVGTVVEKNYEPARTYMFPEQVCVPSSSGTTHCTTRLTQRYDTEDYVISVRLDSDADKVKDVDIDPATYADIQVGDHYTEGQ